MTCIYIVNILSSEFKIIDYYTIIKIVKINFQIQPCNVGPLFLQLGTMVHAPLPFLSWSYYGIMTVDNLKEENSELLI